MRIPRIAFIDHAAQLSGGELALLRLLVGVGDAIDPLVVLGEHGPLIKDLENQGIEVVVLPMLGSISEVKVSSPGSSLVRPDRVIDLVRTATELSRLLRLQRVELVHTNSMKANFYGGMAGRHIGVPVIWHCRDIVGPGYMATAPRLAFRAGMQFLPSGLIANSPSTLSAASPPKRVRSMVLPSLIFPKDVTNTTISSNFPPPSGEPIIASVGRIVPWKGHDLLLKAVAAVEGIRPQVWIAGDPLLGEADWPSRLRELVDQLGITQQVTWLGHIENIREMLSKVDLFVHSSIIPEPFGQVVFEAMAAGTCVIAPEAGGPADYGTNGKDLLFYEMGNRAHLTEKIEAALSNTEMRKRLGEGGQETAAQFAPDKAIPRLLAYYEMLLRPSR